VVGGLTCRFGTKSAVDNASSAIEPGKGRELRQWRARSAMIFQQFNLIGRLDVLANVLMGKRVKTK